MCIPLPPLVSRGLLGVLCGLIVAGGVDASPAPDPEVSNPRPDHVQVEGGAALTEFQSPEETQSTPPREQDSSEQTSREKTTGPGQTSPEETLPSASEHEESFGEQVLEIILGTIILGPIITILLGLLLAFPAVLLGVSLVMDGGCLRYLLFGVGWLCALVYGGLVGAIIGEMILGLEFLVKPIFYVFMWGYPVVAYWSNKKLQAMPEEQYRAWDQTLTGGALLGFGAGSIAGLLRSAASGFGGFGGGSFGGGGASGSWSGASGAAGGTSSTATGGASSTAASTATTAAGGTSKAAAVATGAAPGVASTDASNTPADASDARGLWARLRRWFQKFQWYHGLVFVLSTLVFVPLGLGTMQALKNTKFFVFVLVSVVLYGGYKLLRRNPNVPRSVLRSVSSFQGGEASSSWS